MPVNEQDIIDEEKYRIQGAKAFRADVLNQPAVNLPNQRDWVAAYKRLTFNKGGGPPPYYGRGLRLPNAQRPTVEVRDPAGGVAGVKVWFQSTTPNLQLGDAERVTNNAGRATLGSLQLGDQPGDYELIASTSVLRDTLRFRITAVDLKLLSPTPESPRISGAPNENAPVRVGVFGARGAPVSGVEVRFRFQNRIRNVVTNEKGEAACPDSRFPAGAAYNINISACGLHRSVTVSHT